jgi:hypothetical protein
MMPAVNEDRQRAGLEVGEIGARIAAAFAGERNRWRTLGGVARATGLTLEAVESYLKAHPEEFRQSRLKPAGEPLYARIQGEE